MKNISCLISIIILFAITNNRAQTLDKPGYPLKSIFDYGRKNNVYVLSRNPAFLPFDADEEMLYLRSTLNNFNGDFKAFTTPGRTTFIQQSASGKKKINESQIFKGSFGFIKEIRSDWDWIVTRDVLFGMPFLIGDSTSGQTHYNGIAMQAEYSHQISNRLLIGSELNYYVDEGLKEVSPKPTTRHRDILFRAGFGYLLNKNISLGTVFSIKDNNEEIYYREDKASVYEKTILYKFRGYDLPIVFNKKVETRYSYFDEYSTFSTFTYQINQNNIITAFGGGGIQQLEIKDNAIHPQAEGYWKNTMCEAGIQSSYRLLNSLSIGLIYDVKNHSMWARQPLFNVLISEVDKSEQSFTCGILNQISSRFSIGLETDLGITGINFNDYYSKINWEVERKKWKAQIGANIKWSNDFSTSMAYGFGKLDASTSSFSFNAHSAVMQLRANDVYFYLTDYAEHNVNIVFQMNAKFLGVIRFYGTYRHLVPQASDYFVNDYWSEFLGTLEFMINTF